jgi:hypothetical protein
MQKIMRLSILFVFLFTFLIVFSPVDVQAKIRFPDTCINFPGCGLTVPPNASYCEAGVPLGIITDKDSDPIKDAEFTFIHAPIDTFKYPDRIEISGYLEPEFACFNFPGYLPSGPNYVKNVNRYEMPCDRDFKTTTRDISVAITVNSPAGVPNAMPPIIPSFIKVFRDTIPSGTEISSCSKNFRYKGPFLRGDFSDVPRVNPDARYELKFQNRTDRTYFYLKIDKEFFFTKTLGSPLGPFTKYKIAANPCTAELCSTPPLAVPPDVSVCEDPAGPGPCCGNVYANPLRSLTPGAPYYECSEYLDYIQSITSFDIEIQVGAQSWYAFNVPVDLNKLSCCRNVNKQELDFK